VLLLEWLKTREEQCVAIVCHGMFINALFSGDKIRHDGHFQVIIFAMTLLIEVVVVIRFAMTLLIEVVLVIRFAMTATSR
jgi:hypothetical protein